MDDGIPRKSERRLRHALPVRPRCCDVRRQAEPDVAEAMRTHHTTVAAGAAGGWIEREQGRIAGRCAIRRCGQQADYS